MRVQTKQVYLNFLVSIRSGGPSTVRINEVVQVCNDVER